VSERGVRIGPGQSIPLAEIELRASRSSGPGGQHANVTASRIEAVFEIEPSASLTAEQKARLAHRYGKRVTAIAQDARSQARNRDLALRRLRERLADGLRVAPARRPTRPTRASVNRRLDAKRRQAARKAERRRPATD
jgi:ribosome-associated protein